MHGLGLDDADDSDRLRDVRAHIRVPGDIDDLIDRRFRGLEAELRRKVGIDHHMKGLVRLPVVPSRQQIVVLIVEHPPGQRGHPQDREEISAHEIGISGPRG